jgi:tetrahydromethanopterin S-methyltransferase subunit D
MLACSTVFSFSALTYLLNTRLIFGVALIGFAFVGGGVWHFLPWSRGPAAHAFSLGVGTGLFAAAVAFLVPFPLR